MISDNRSQQSVWEAALEHRAASLRKSILENGLPPPDSVAIVAASKWRDGRHYGDVIGYKALTVLSLVPHPILDKSLPPGSDTDLVAEVGASWLSEEVTPPEVRDRWTDAWIEHLFRARDLTNLSAFLPDTSRRKEMKFITKAWLPQDYRRIAVLDPLFQEIQALDEAGEIQTVTLVSAIIVMEFFEETSVLVDRRTKVPSVRHKTPLDLYLEKDQKRS